MFYPGHPAYPCEMDFVLVLRVFAGHAGDSACIAGGMGEGIWAQGLFECLSHSGLFMVNQNRANVDAFACRHSRCGALQVGDVVVFKTLLADFFVIRIWALGLCQSSNQEARQDFDARKGNADFSK